MADWDSSAVSVLLGDGAGGFAAKKDFTTGSHPNSVAVGDFNGDGRQDLAVADWDSSAVSVLLGDGAGGFAAKTDFATGLGPQSVAIGDFNGDGKQDLAASGATSRTVSILLGKFEAPSGSVTLSGGAGVTASRSVTVDAGVSEATQMRVRNAGGAWGEWLPYVHAAIWTLPAGDGEKTVETEYRNSVGATGVLSASILLDATAPQTTSDAASGWVTSSPATVTLEASDGEGSGVAKTQYKLDDAAAWSTGTSVPIAADGVHTLRYRSVDAAGNAEETQFALVRLDATPPDVSVSGVDDAWHRGPVLAALSATDAVSGVAALSYRLDNGAWAPGWALLVTADGDHTLEYRAADHAGNVSAEQTVHVKVDTTGPTTSGKAVKVRRGKKAVFRVKVADALCTGAATKAKVVIRTRGGKHVKTLPWTRVTIGKTAQITWKKCAPKRGTYRYYVYAKDAAGNPQQKAGGNRLVVK